MNLIKLSRKSKYILILFLSFLVLILIWPDYMSYTYLKRIALYRESDINDYKVFPFREMKASESPFIFPQGNMLDINKLKDINYKSNKNNKLIGDFEKFLTDTKTTSFIIIKDDQVIYEKYFNGYQRDSINTSISMAKSFTSALIGFAIQDGYIKSVEDSITAYIPELEKKDQRFKDIKIKDLLQMSSGLEYSEGPLFFGDDATTYYSENLRKLALNIKYKNTPQKEFLYNNYNPLLLGMIIERSTKSTVTDYLDKKIWQSLGMEYSGSWSLDSSNGFEKMESGINARSIDFAKFGQLFLKNGNWGEKELLPKSWIEESTKFENKDREYYKNLEGWNVDMDKTFYRFMWWGYHKNDKTNDYYARGKYGQYIYISPSTNTVIVRNGISAGDIDFWPEIFSQIADKL